MGFHGGLEPSSRSARPWKSTGRGGVGAPTDVAVLRHPHAVRWSHRAEARFAAETGPPCRRNHTGTCRRVRAGWRRQAHCRGDFARGWRPVHCREIRPVGEGAPARAGNGPSPPPQAISPLSAGRVRRGGRLTTGRVRTRRLLQYTIHKPSSVDDCGESRERPSRSRFPDVRKA